MQILKTILLGGAVLGLASCGETDLERGAYGAATGAAIAVALDENVVVGASLGAAAGVLSDDFIN